MPNFSERRICKLHTLIETSLSTNDNFLLYAHKSTNPQFLYWNYQRFDLDKKTKDECMAEFRFYSEDIYEHLLSKYNHNLLSPKIPEESGETITSCCFKTLAKRCH